MKNVFRLLSVLLMLVFLSSCNSTYVDYMDSFNGYEQTIGDLTNNETVEELSLIYSDETAVDINVLPVELDDDYIIGVDISSVIAVEEAGGVFYNEKGEEQDVFEILKEYGVNYVRIRLWNEPYTEDGDYYGGGNNDIDTALEIAKRAARVGMKIALDFHYSDFWADPSKQTVPREWADYDLEKLKDAVYKYTYKTLKKFKNEGVLPHMVQIGNEVNNGLMWPVGSFSNGYSNIYELLQSGIDAVNDISEEIITVIHLADGTNTQSITGFFDEMIDYGLDFDVIGLSYYSYWHGDMDEFQETLKVLDETYDKEIAVMEYSYGYTDLETENAVHIYSSELEELGGYLTSMQGQASYIRDVNYAISQIESGIGSFYWEPAWLPVEGAGWASEAAREYLEAQNDASSSLTHVSWANQALFSYTGKVLPTLDVFNLMRTSTFDLEEIEEYEAELSTVINLAAEDGLPEYTYVTTSLDRVIKKEVIWDEDEIADISSPGEYVVRGTFENAGQLYDVICNVSAYTNYLLNPSFEDNEVSSDVKDFSMIDAWEIDSSPEGAIRIESKNPRQAENDGHNNANIWSNSAYEFRLYQTITLPAGTYQLSVWARSATDSADYPDVKLFAESSGLIIEETDVTYGASWSEWVNTTLVFTIAEETEVTIGVYGSGKANSWAHFDDFSLQSAE